MGGRDFQNMKNFVKNVVSHIDITNGSSRVGVFTFSNQAKLEFDLKTYKTNEDIIKAIDAIPQYFGNTNTAAALRAVTEQGFTKNGGDRENIPNVAVLITDGVANMEIDQTLPESKIVKSEGIYLYAFAIKFRAHSEFQKISSVPSNRTAVFLPNFESLISYSPSFMQALCEDCMFSLIDIVFVLDSSTSVGGVNFKKMLYFVRQMISDANVHPSGIRVGLMTFGTSSKIIFNLNEIGNKLTLNKEIEKVAYSYGNTNTADAIRTMRTKMFQKENGDRENVKNVAVIITDGVSNIKHHLVSTEAKLAHDAGIQMIAIGINLNSLNELDSIASKPLEQNRFVVDDFNRLAEIKTSLFPTTCLGIKPLHTQNKHKLYLLNERLLCFSQNIYFVFSGIITFFKVYNVQTKIKLCCF